MTRIAKLLEIIGNSDKSWQYAAHVRMQSVSAYTIGVIDSGGGNAIALRQMILSGLLKESAVVVLVVVEKDNQIRKTQVIQQH